MEAYWADLAAVWEARHLVAKLHVCSRGSLAKEVAVRVTAGAEAAGRREAIMVAITSVCVGLDED